MLSKARIKFIKSLQVKKYRKQEQSFVVEGAKSVIELLRSDFDTEVVVASAGFIRSYASILKKNREVIEATEKELAQLGSFQTNDAALAVAKMKANKMPHLKDEFCLVLDDLHDPGNVGTIIRTADWYGIQNIVASEQTADFYNPKTISATMGSFTRVNIFYTNLTDFLSKNKLPVYGTLMQGDNVHRAVFGSSGLIVIGNESNGISEEVMPFITHPITIPQLGGAESLNAAIATGIVLDNLCRSKE
ncbi:MAG: RNA methyltransferase [Bacteroidetes bacterium]|nr:RNA methyltransferase [Bacteroidota bacterium]MBS1539767.1 RNA methyltransferase [Bacteroidota bacterium]